MATKDDDLAAIKKLLEKQQTEIEDLRGQLASGKGKKKKAYPSIDEVPAPKIEPVEFFLVKTSHLKQFGQAEPVLIEADANHPVVVKMPSHIFVRGEWVEHPEYQHLKRSKPAPPKETHPKAKGRPDGKQASKVSTVGGTAARLADQ